MIKPVVRICFLFFLSFLLTMMPWPSVLMGIKPAWLLLVLLYIQFFIPAYFNVFFVLLLGLCLDVLLSTVLGEHAFALLLTTWIAAEKKQRFHFYSMGQQLVAITLFCLIYQSILFFFDWLVGYRASMLTLLGNVLLSMFIWPWMVIILDRFLLITVLSRRKR